MDTKFVWLECNVLKENNIRDLEVEIKLQDDSTTVITVHPTIVGKTENKSYVKVEYLAKMNNLTYIKLPRPSMQHGHNITVSSFKLKETL